MSRERVRLLVDHPVFQRFIIGVILVNAATLGLETWNGLMSQAGPLLHALDYAALAIFVVELALRMYAHRGAFFRDPWSIFDLVVILVAIVPASGPFAVVRALRVLRALRLISRVRSMNRVVTGLLAAIPGMASIAALLALVLYVAGVISTSLFGHVLPEYFGNLGTAVFTLFQVMTGEAWPDIARELMAQVPLAWIFFVVYILVSSFAVLNLFIAVVVNAMEGAAADERQVEEMRLHEEELDADREILEEVKALRREVAELRESMARDSA